MDNTTRPNPSAASPAAPPTAASPNTEADRLEQVLPQIRDLAAKVGGYRKLAEIARQLDQSAE